MDTKFINASDKNVANYVVYGKSADSKLYLESDYKTQVPVSVAKAAFEKGLLIIKNGDVVLVPVNMSTNKFLTVALSSGSLAGTEWLAKAE